VAILHQRVGTAKDILMQIALEFSEKKAPKNRSNSPFVLGVFTHFWKASQQKRPSSNKT
jgi:hypothetical protein